MTKAIKWLWKWYMPIWFATAAVFFLAQQEWWTAFYAAIGAQGWFLAESWSDRSAAWERHSDHLQEHLND